jgi:hypothetical protein
MKRPPIAALNRPISRRLQLLPTLALAALVLFSASDLMGQRKTKPGDGGSGGDTAPVPAGTIHFTQSTADGWTYAEMTMKADGSAKTQIGTREQGNAWKPSYQLHSGKRWFLNMRDTGVDEYGWIRQELFAVTAAGDLVQLTDDLDLWVHNVRWAKDDSFVSYAAYNEITDAEDLYVAYVDWSSGSPVVGVPSNIFPISAGDLQLNYLGAYDWSPAGDEMVYNDTSDGREVRVARFLADGSFETRHLGNGLYPTWSSDGNWIAYGGAGIWKIRPDGSGAVQLSTATSGQQHFGQNWSPDGQHLAFTQSTRTTSTKRGVTTTTYTYVVLRISANGGTATNLTTDTSANYWTIGWR